MTKVVPGLTWRRDTLRAMMDVGDDRDREWASRYLQAAEALEQERKWYRQVRDVLYNQINERFDEYAEIVHNQGRAHAAYCRHDIINMWTRNPDIFAAETACWNHGIDTVAIRNALIAWDLQHAYWQSLRQYTPETVSVNNAYCYRFDKDVSQRKLYITMTVISHIIIVLFRNPLYWLLIPILLTVLMAVPMPGRAAVAIGRRPAFIFSQPTPLTPEAADAIYCRWLNSDRRYYLVLAELVIAAIGVTKIMQML